MKKSRLLVFAGLLALPLAASPAFAGDAAKGEALANKKCTTCHAFPTFKKKGKIGPPIGAGIVGSKAGQDANFKYSKALKKAADGGLVWDEANLDKFLESPKKMIKGTKMMAFPGFKKEADRKNVIAFLKTL
ncbi:MAG: c-type cytochrome [Magnetococcales bacterium]|nr:c-type cytochrome [Magnetococcales bacterium]